MARRMQWGFVVKTIAELKNAYEAALSKQASAKGTKALLDATAECVAARKAYIDATSAETMMKKIQG